MIELHVKHNTDSVMAELVAGVDELATKAMVRAINKTADQVKVQAAREVRAAGYNIRVGDIKRQIRVRYASQGRLRAEVIAQGRPIPLYQYGARQTGKGVTVNVRDGRKTIAGAFIATMPSGHVGVYVREPGARHVKMANARKPGWHALPIRELFGPSVPDGLANAAVQQALQALVVERFPTILARESAWLAKRSGR